MIVAGLMMWGGELLLCTRRWLIVMLLIAVVDCHDFDHVMFEDCQAYLVGLLSGMVKNHPLWGKKFTWWLK